MHLFWNGIRLADLLDLRLSVVCSCEDEWTLLYIKTRKKGQCSDMNRADENLMGLTI